MVGAADVYRYLYASLYVWGLRTWGQKDGPQYNAMLGLSALGVINAFNALMIAEAVHDGERLLGNNAGWIAVLLFVGLVAFHHRWFTAGDRPQQLARWRERLGSDRRHRLQVFAWLYPIASLLLFATLLATRS